MSPGVTADWAIELAVLGKSYPVGWTGGRFHALRSVSLRLASGQVLGLLGPNGSGKSTTLKALAGLIVPTAGSCRILGHAAGSEAARALVGYLPEAPQFSPHLTGRGYLHFCAGLSSLAAAASAARVEQILGWCGLESAADRRLAGYSKGMRQRLGLAQAILHDPAVLLLDEPTSGLDPGGRLVFGRMIRDLAARGKTVVFSSHLVAQAGDWCDRLAILGQGRLLAEGTPMDLLGAPRSEVLRPTCLEELYLRQIDAAV